jgi:hypothetical protein
VFYSDPPWACRVLGIINDVLEARPRYDGWKYADGFLFKTEETNILNIAPGGSTDTSRCATLQEFQSAV